MEKADLILRLLEESRTETNRRLDQMAKSFEEFRDETNRRFDQADRMLDRIEEELRSEKQKLEGVHRARDRVKITFGWQWGMASFIIAVVAAGLARLLV